MSELYLFNAANLAVKSIINTASIYPKLGLLTPLTNRAVDGIDFFTAVNAAMALFQCFVNCVSVGADTQSLNPQDAFSILRSSGQIGINDALRASNGKLSLKGYVFTLGLLCASAGKLIAQKRILTPTALTLSASSYVEGITSRELWELNPDTQKVFSPGERAYISFGFEGVRGEVEYGFKNTLKAFELLQALREIPVRERCSHVLLSIMADNDDTNLVAHGGITELMRVKKEVQHILDLGGMFKEEGLTATFEADKIFHHEHISPKASCVILANALFLQDLMKLKATRSGYIE